MYDCVPLSKEHIEIEQPECNQCNKKSKYMFEISVRGFGGEPDECMGVYCYRCIASEYNNCFPHPKKEDDKS